MIKKQNKGTKKVPTGTDTRLITPYTSYLLPEFNDWLDAQVEPLKLQNCSQIIIIILLVTLVAQPREVTHPLATNHLLPFVNHLLTSLIPHQLSTFLVAPQLSARLQPVVVVHHLPFGSEKL